MRRHHLRRYPPPSEDGAFYSTSRAELPPLASPRQVNNGLASASDSLGQHSRHHRRAGNGPTNHLSSARGGLFAAHSHAQGASGTIAGPDQTFEDDGDSDLEEGDEDVAEDDNDVEEEDEDYEMEDDIKDTSLPIPPNLREISSLASWSVSSYKPGCGIISLRHPSTSQFWQSDGPQPHTLTLHFFKRVSVVRIRVYLDLELDESYTPTKMVFMAGMGGNDLVEFATWQGEAPCGWVDIPLDGVGGRHENRAKKKRRDQTKNGATSSKRNDHNEQGLFDSSMIDEELDSGEDDLDPSAGNVLKAMVIQVRICENHQNGKDTHVRGFQVFALDDKYYTRTRRDSTQRSLRNSGGARKDTVNMRPGDDRQDFNLENGMGAIDESDWFLQPEIR